jgi:ParB family chromosome partitioning protein
MKSSAKNIQVTKFDDLFSAGNPAEAGGSGNVQEIPLTELFPFKDHPFKVLDDETMQDTVESIRIHGVLVPGIARPRAEGGYELIAGHRRRHASELAGKTTMPVIVRELDDDEAVLFMVDSNIQRENLFPSEKAWAYKMKLDALKHQGVKDTSRQLGEKYSVDALSENSNDSARNIHRFIRLTQLLPELLQMVDDKKLSFNPAVELSYLTREQQGELMGIMGELQAVPSLEQAKRLKKYSQEGKLDRNVMDAILTEERPAPVQVTLKNDRLKQYFPQTYTAKQMEEVIFSLLETWKTQNT